MLLSVIIPAYNAQRYLDAAVRSVLRQRCGEPEIIIVDDGSEDRTGQVADRLAREHSSVRVIHTENRGAARARNLGLDVASGDYVAFLDADDVWCADAIDGTVQHHLFSGLYDILSFGYIPAEPGLRFGRCIPETSGLLENNDPEYDRAASGKSFCSYIFRRSLMKDVRFPEGIRYNEDTTFLFLVTRKAKNILRIDKYLFIYRNQIHSAMHAPADWRYILTDEIPAWSWARQQVTLEKDRLICDGMVYDLMWDYLRRSALWGTPFRELQEDIRCCPSFQDTLTRLGSFWTRPEAVRFHNSFARAPQKLCRRYRLLGIFPKTARRLSRNRFFRTLYFLLKYRTPLRNYTDGADS